MIEKGFKLDIFEKRNIFVHNVNFARRGFYQRLAAIGGRLNFYRLEPARNGSVARRNFLNIANISIGGEENIQAQREKENSKHRNFIEYKAEFYF